MTAREHLLILIAAVFTAEHNSARHNEDVFNTIDRALKTANVYLEYCEKKLNITYE